MKLMHRRITVQTTRALVTVSICAWLLAGCATQRQVQDIVATANLATFSAELGLGETAPGKPGGSGESWKEANVKIENFIALNPGNKPTVAALRIRQAMLLLNHRQFELARAAFAEAKLADLRGSSRDRALKRLEEELLWWYATANSTLGPGDFVTGERAMQSISQISEELRTPENQGIRDWLGALQAWIGLKLANDADADILGKSTVNRYLEAAVNTFAENLPADELAAWESAPEFPPANVTEQTAVSPSMRRRFRAHDLIEAARVAIANNQLTGLDIREPYFRERILR